MLLRAALVIPDHRLRQALASTSRSIIVGDELVDTPLTRPAEHRGFSETASEALHNSEEAGYRWGYSEVAAATITVTERMPMTPKPMASGRVSVRRDKRPARPPS
jgi:hypothetical protein